MLPTACKFHAAVKSFSQNRYFYYLAEETVSGGVGKAARNLHAKRYGQG